MDIFGVKVFEFIDKLLKKEPAVGLSKKNKESSNPCERKNLDEMILIDLLPSFDLFSFSFGQGDYHCSLVLSIVLLSIDGSKSFGFYERMLGR